MVPLRLFKEVLAVNGAAKFSITDVQAHVQTTDNGIDMIEFESAINQLQKRHNMQRNHKLMAQNTEIKVQPHRYKNNRSVFEKINSKSTENLKGMVAQEPGPYTQENDLLFNSGS